MFSQWFASRAAIDADDAQEADEMPEDEQEVSNIFDKLLDELGLPEASREAVAQKSAEKKWKLICSHRKYEGGVEADQKHPWQFVETLDSNPGPQDVADLRELIVTNGTNWHSTFFNCGGLDALAMVLRDLNRGTIADGTRSEERR